MSKPKSMGEPKFKIGDCVSILNDPRFVFDNGMLRPGMMATVTDMVIVCDEYVYKLNNERFVYSENVLELVAHAETDIAKTDKPNPTDTDILFQVLAALADIRNTISRLLSKCGYE